MNQTFRKILATTRNKNLPTNWNESKVLESEMGEFDTLARRFGNEWFLGSLTENNKRSVKINLHFLDANTNYQAIIHFHNAGLQTVTKVRATSLAVTSESKQSW